MAATRAKKFSAKAINKDVHICRSGEFSVDLRKLRPYVRKRKLSKVTHQPKKRNISENMQRKTLRGEEFQVHSEEFVQDDTINSDSEQPHHNPSISVVVGMLSELENYIHLLRENDGLCPVDLNYRQFVIQDLSPDEKLLKKHGYLFVTRVAKILNNDVVWLYKCSCDKVQEEFIDSLHYSLSITLTDLSSIHSKCIHIEAFQNIIKEFDTYYDIEPKLDFEDHSYGQWQPTYDESQPNDKDFTDVFPVGKDSVICVKAETYGVVVIDSGKLRCTTCTFGYRHCLHVKLINTYFEQENSNLPDVLIQLKESVHASEQSRKQNVCDSRLCSKKRIPFILPKNLCNQLCKPSTERFERKNGTIKLITPEDTCTLCQQALIEGSERTVVIITESDVLEATAYKKKCSTCDHMVVFDGQELGLLNMGSYLVSYEILRRYMFYFFTGRSTMYTEYTVLTKVFEDKGYPNLKQVFSYNHFRLAWYAFMDLLEIDFDEDFSCCICKDHPTAVVMDATSLSFRREFSTWNNTVSNIQRPKGKSFPKGIYLTNKNVCKQLREFATKGLCEDDLNKLQEDLEKHDKQLLNLLDKIPKTLVKNKLILPKHWMRFIYSLASNTPVCGFIKPDPKLFQILQDLNNTDITKDASSLKYLQENIPLIFDIIKYEQCIPIEMAGIFAKLKEKSTEPFILHPDTEAVTQPINIGKDATTYYPKLPVHRARGLYALDNNTAYLACNKYSKGHPTLLPGLFTLFCKHGKCYGFEVMHLHESPNVPFTMLFTRFSKAPDLVIYDNACNLHKYCLNREPVFFQNTSFKVDSLHWANHSACSPSYELKSYPQYQQINSQVAEQYNSLLQRIKGPLSYMNQYNFMNHVKFYLWARNMDIFKTKL